MVPHSAAHRWRLAGGVCGSGVVGAAVASSWRPHESHSRDSAHEPIEKRSAVRAPGTGLMSAERRLRRRRVQPRVYLTTAIDDALSVVLAATRSRPCRKDQEPQVAEAEGTLYEPERPRSGSLGERSWLGSSELSAAIPMRGRADTMFVSAGRD